MEEGVDEQVQGFNRNFDLSEPQFMFKIRNIRLGVEGVDTVLPSRVCASLSVLLGRPRVQCTYGTVSREVSSRRYPKLNDKRSNL